MPEDEKKDEQTEKTKTEETKTAETKTEETKKEETYTVKIDGEDRNLSIDELKTLASKSAGADKRFSEAAEASKAAEKGIRVETLIKAVSSNDNPSEADIRELAGLLEIDPKDFMQYLHEEESPEKNTNKSDKNDFGAQFQKEMGGSTAEFRAIVEHSQNRHVQDARKEIREITDLAVDKDEIIVKMVEGKDKESIIKTVKDMVAEDVFKKITDGTSFGAEVVTASVQRVRSTLTKLGISNKLDQHPIVLGLAPGEALPPEIHADEPIKRISSADDPDEKNLTARYLQKAIQAQREQR